MKRSESRQRLKQILATRKMGKSEVGTSGGGVNTAGKADRLTKTVKNSPTPDNFGGAAKRPGLASGSQIADTTTNRLAAQSKKKDAKASMPNVRSGYQAVADYQKSKTIAPEKKGMGLYPGGVKRRVGGPTRGSEARADATRTVGQNAQRQREADTMQKIRDKAAKTAGGQIRNNYAQARSNQSQAAAGSKFAAPKPAPNAAQAATSPATPPPHPQAAVAAAVAAKTTKADASRAALPVSAVKAATKTGGQTVNKGTSKAPIANPRMKQMQQQRVGNWKNAETVSSYRKRMAMKEQRIWNLIESNETEPLKDKVVDKVKKEKKSAGKKGTTDMGGPTDIIDTEPQKTVQVGQQSR